MAKVLLLSFILTLLHVHFGITANNSTESYPIFMYKNPADDSNQNTSTLRGIEAVVTFTVYNRKNPEGVQVTPSDTNNKLQSVFIQSIPMKFITHGWLVTENSSSVADLRVAYLRTNDVNVVTVGWSTISQNEYVITTFRLAGVGVMVGKLVARLLDADLISLEHIHLIGHSLGAHVMGIAGHFISNSGYGKVKRVTGLDPAKPLYELPINKSSSLDSEDGQFVDVIHTCIGKFGLVEPIGHADFYPNGGYCVQPACIGNPGIFCSHRQAFIYFEESIYNEFAYPAVKCDSYFSYEFNLCQNGEVTYMGNPTPSSTRGTFYLKAVSSEENNNNNL